MWSGGAFVGFEQDLWGDYGVFGVIRASTFPICTWGTSVAILYWLVHSFFFKGRGKNNETHNTI